LHRKNYRWRHGLQVKERLPLLRDCIRQDRIGMAGGTVSGLVGAVAMWLLAVVFGNPNSG
jgi:hypothetical protein